MRLPHGAHLWARTDRHQSLDVLHQVAKTGNISIIEKNRMFFSESETVYWSFLVSSAEAGNSGMFLFMMLSRACTGADSG